MQFSVDRCSSGLKELRKHLQDKKKKKSKLAISQISAHTEKWINFIQ